MKGHQYRKVFIIMKRRFRKNCPLCDKVELLKLSNHLAQQHSLSRVNRAKHLKTAKRQGTPQVLLRGWERLIRDYNPNNILSKKEHAAFVWFAKQLYKKGIINSETLQSVEASNICAIKDTYRYFEKKLCCLTKAITID